MAEHSREGVVPRAIVGGLTPEMFRVLSVDVSAGGRQLDHAAVEVDLGFANRYMRDMDLSNLSVPTPQGDVALNGAEMTILADVGGMGRVLHWGKTSVYELQLPDRLVLVSRLEQTHFGQPLGFQKVYDPETKKFVRSDFDVVFNPEVQGAIVGNKRPGDGSQQKPFAFIQPGSIATSQAALVQGVAYVEPSNVLRISEISNQNWSLVDAVAYVLADCNPDQQYVLNPPLGELQQILPQDRTVLKNHRLRVGMYLPEALDQILEPYGFTWRVHYESTSSRRIQIIRNGVGRQRSLLLQAPGGKFDATRTNTERLAVTYDSSMAVNQVRAIGDFTQIEATFELMPAWQKQYDSVAQARLFSGNRNWPNTPQFHDVWRTWVLNEDGSYLRGWGDGKFPPNKPNPNITKYFREVYGQKHPVVVPRRRKFLPMLTLGEGGKPFGDVGGCLVEWWNERKKGGAGWEPIDPNLPFFSCRLLEDECGIRFDGPPPPYPIRRAGNAARVRITAVIQSDSRMVALAKRQDDSVNPDTHEFVADVAQRFHARLLHKDSVFFAAVESGARKAEQLDGQDSLQAFADATRQAFDQAGCAGHAVLEGLEHDYVVGDLVTALQGRGIRFALNKGQSETGRYLQVVGLSYQVQGQKLLVALNDYRGTDTLFAGVLRKTKRLK